MNKIKCEVCGKEYSAKGIGTHMWRAHGAGKDHNPNIGFLDGSRSQWNIGLTKDSDSRVAQYSVTKAKPIGKSPSQQTKKLLSDAIKSKFKTGEMVGWNRLRIYRENPEIGNKPAILYVCKFQKDDTSFVKVGITEKQSAQKRYKVKSDTKQFNIETVLEIRMTNLTAAELERQILNTFKHHKFSVPEHLRFEGYTECLCADVLGDVLKAIDGDSYRN